MNLCFSTLPYFSELDIFLPTEGGALGKSNNAYDDLGRLVSNRRNGITNLITNYQYNIRSWTKSTSAGSLFNQTLFYNGSYGGNNPRYNGNISAMSWSMSGSTVKGYRFGYDELSRLKSAGYLENVVANTQHCTSYTYDKLGNIITLQRSGSTASIQYNYDANGNMTKDLNKGIGNIQYNSLNLPRSLNISNRLGSATNAYVYAADGNNYVLLKVLSRRIM